MQSPSGLVIGTAGHIDHGKTSLVRALTGIDTDRLAEEKKRGISIDLGFAHMTLPDGGGRISFVDVPGHERFIKNMLAGVAGIDAVLLTVAADESVKPQTREHFDICRLLQVQRGVIVLTKIDLASAEQIAATLADVRHLVRGSFLESAPIVHVSAIAGSGLAELKQQLLALSRTVQRRDAAGYARLPIDRSFALKGFGTVVTGTLWTGTLRAGDVVLLHPLARELRIRGLQVHGQKVSEAHAGERTAVNLTGIEHEEIRRGFTLTSRAELECSALLDAEIEWLREAEVPSRRQELFVHIGTAEVMGDVKLIAPGKPYARLRLSEPVLAFPGDRLILRRPTPADTVAGGLIIDSFPKRRMNRARLLARCHSLARTGLNERLQLLAQENKAGLSLSELVRVTSATPERIKAAIAHDAALVYIETSHRVVSRRSLDEGRRELIQWLARFHAANPAATGAPIAEARRMVDAAFADVLVNHDPAIVVRGDVVALAAHKPRVSSGELNALMQLEHAFREAGFHPPSLNELLRATDPDAKKARGMLESLIKSGRLVRLSPDLVYHADVIAHVRNTLAAHKGRKFSVPEFKEWTQVSRKYAIPLLEYLDRVHVTRRDGDSRVVL